MTDALPRPDPTLRALWMHRLDLGALWVAVTTGAISLLIYGHTLSRAAALFCGKPAGCELAVWIVYGLTDPVGHVTFVLGAGWVARAVAIPLGAGLVLLAALLPIRIREILGSLALVAAIPYAMVALVPGLPHYTYYVAILTMILALKYQLWRWVPFGLTFHERSFRLVDASLETVKDRLVPRRSPGVAHADLLIAEFSEPSSDVSGNPRVTCPHDAIVVIDHLFARDTRRSERRVTFHMTQVSRERVRIDIDVLMEDLSPVM